MSNTLEATKQAFYQWMKRMKAYDEAASVLYWDMRTGAPKKGVAARAEVLAFLSAERFKMSVAPEMAEFIQILSSPEYLPKLDAVTRKAVSECARDFERSQKIPPALYEEYVTLTTQAESLWEEAKERADFAMFRPSLEKIVEFNKKFVELWGYEEHPYDALLDLFEPGATVAQLDVLFHSMRARLVPLLQQIRQSSRQPDAARLIVTNAFEKTAQRDFCLHILGELGYDFAAGRLDESSHPFATGLNLGDVRITTRYSADDLSGALFGTIHEFGHALYDQNIDASLAGTVLCDGTSMGIHESQSRFWENIIARSRPFWHRYYGALQQAFPTPFAEMTADEFYRAINHVEPSLIRTEADELTYNLHVMIRYELEKALFGGELQVADLPAAWNQKYKEYLGIEPHHDGVGVLQDVHWSAGLFGYFPSYSLGNMGAAQLAEAIRTAIPDLESRIEQGDFAPLRHWLKEHIHRHGKLRTPAELMEQATGRPLSADDLLSYLETKYRAIYL